MDKFTELNKKYNAFDFYKEKLDDNFLEFTLEELGMPSAKWLYKQTLNISNDIGGIKGWHMSESHPSWKNNTESSEYRGFSICMNPKGDEHLQSPYKL